jgi:hypothetical protein
MNRWRCRGGNRICSFTGKMCTKEQCEAYMWDGALVVEKERNGVSHCEAPLAPSQRVGNPSVRMANP